MLFTSNIFEDETTELKCSVCGKDVVDKPEEIVFFLQQEGNSVIDIVLACEESCTDLIDTDECLLLYDLTNPYLYFNNIMVTLDLIHKRNVTFTDAAFEKYRDLIMAMAPYVFRDMSEDELAEASIRRFQAAQWEAIK